MSEPKPSIAVACSSPSWGGMEMQTVISAEELARRDYPVVLLTARETPIAAEGGRRGLEVVPLLSHHYVAPVAILRMARLLRRHAVRLVHTEYSKDLWTVVPATRLAGGTPVILTKRLASSVDKTDPLHRYLYAKTARIIAISRMIGENVRRHTAVRPERIVVIPDGVEVAHFPPDRPEREAARRELGVPEDAPAIGLLGRISRGKGQIDFLRAAPKVAAEYQDARFLLIGSVTKGEEAYAEKVHDLARSIDLGKRLILTGFREDVPRVLSALDLLVVPSREEALGDVVLEGMAAGLPIAAVGRGGIRDLVVEGETGLFFEPDDPEGLADTVLRLLGDPDLRRALGEQGRQRVEIRFDLPIRTNQIEALYAEVLTEIQSGMGRSAPAA